MASIQLKEVELQSANPAMYSESFQFRITVDVLEDLPDDLEVRFVWVGSCESNAFDQKLEELLIGPLRVGTNEFVAQVPPPRWELIPAWDILGVTLLLVTLNYRDQEFVRVGYWVQVAYANVNEDPSTAGMPKTIEIEHIGRNVLLTHPTVRTSAIDWGTGQEESMEGIFPSPPRAPREEVPTQSSTDPVTQPSAGAVHE